MPSRAKILALVGSYRKGGTVDTAVDEILASARKESAEAEKIYLVDRHIEFCTNCRQCTQQRGPQRGVCIADDDMCRILDAIDDADAMIIGSPMNFAAVTAVTKRFIERLVCFAYWPWGTGAPEMRIKNRVRPALVVASSAAPSVMARLLTPQLKQLKNAARLAGFKSVGTLFIGFAAMRKNPELTGRTRKKARRLGKRLVARAQTVRARKQE